MTFDPFLHAFSGSPLSDKLITPLWFLCGYDGPVDEGKIRRRLRKMDLARAVELGVDMSVWADAQIGRRISKSIMDLEVAPDPPTEHTWRKLSRGEKQSVHGAKEKSKPKRSQAARKEQLRRERKPSPGGSSYQRMSPEKKEIFLAQQRAKYQALPDEQKEARRATKREANRAAYRAKKESEGKVIRVMIDRSNETAEERAERLRLYHLEWKKQRRLRMTEEEREAEREKKKKAPSYYSNRPLEERQALSKLWNSRKNKPPPPSSPI
jgi:hypothetical protein